MRGWITGVVLFAAGLAGCDDDGPIAPIQEREVIAVLELAVQDIGEPNMSSTVAVASSLAGLDLLNVADATAGGAPSIANAITSFQAIAAGVIDVTPPGSDARRFVHATFRVPEALADGAFDEVDELLLIAVATAGTVAGTPVRLLLRQDGTPVDPALAAQIQATGRPRIDQDGNVRADSSGVIRVLTPADIAAVETLTGILDIFPQGFIVKRSTAQPPGGTDGIVTFALSLPLLEPADANPTTISIMLIAVAVSQT